MTEADPSTARRLWTLAAVASMVLGLILFTPPLAHAEAGFTFVPDPTQPSLPAGDRLVTVAELDGKQDLIVENQAAETIGVMLGNGSGGFSAPSSISLEGHPTSVHVADFNGDSYPDLLVGLETTAPPTPLENSLPNHVEILLGDGKGDFTPGPEIGLPEVGPIYVGDFTGNGDEDLLVAPDARDAPRGSRWQPRAGCLDRATTWPGGRTRGCGRSQRRREA